MLPIGTGIAAARVRRRRAFTDRRIQVKCARYLIEISINGERRPNRDGR